MRRRRVDFALGAVAIVTAAGLLAAQAPGPGGSSPATAPQGPAPAAQTAPAQTPAEQAPAAPASPPAAASQPTQRPSFRGGVDVVSLNVTVTDQSRNFVT